MYIRKKYYAILHITKNTIFESSGMLFGSTKNFFTVAGA